MATRENPEQGSVTRRVRVVSKKSKKLDLGAVPEELQDVRAIIDFIKDLRQKHGVSQKVICEQSGLSASTVSKMENECLGLNIRSLVLVLRYFGFRLKLTFERISDPEILPQAELLAE